MQTKTVLHSLRWTPQEPCPDTQLPAHANRSLPLVLWPRAPGSFWRFFESNFAGLYAAHGSRWATLDTQVGKRKYTYVALNRVLGLELGTLVLESI